MSPFQLKYLAATLAVVGISVAGCSNKQDAAPTAAPAASAVSAAPAASAQAPAENAAAKSDAASHGDGTAATLLTAWLDLFTERYELARQQRAVRPDSAAQRRLAAVAPA